MIEFLLKLFALFAVMMLWGFAWSWAADKDEEEFQEYLNGITKKGGA